MPVWRRLCRHVDKWVFKQSLGCLVFIFSVISRILRLHFEPSRTNNGANLSSLSLSTRVPFHRTSPSGCGSLHPYSVDDLLAVSGFLTRR